MLFMHYKDVVAAHAQEALRRAKFKFLGCQKIIMGRNGEDQPTHISNPLVHFESSCHLSLGFLHPLGF
jgi:hypothetical protein